MLPVDGNDSEEITLILSTHAIVGGAIAGFMRSHPLLAAVVRLASRFAIDAIPHWATIDCGQERREQSELTIERGRVDGPRRHSRGCLCGPGSGLVAIRDARFDLGDCARRAAMLQDPCKFAHSVFPRESLNTLQRFHAWIQSKRELAWRLGVSSQIAVATAVSALAGALH
jgi:hypothetical protein